MSNPYDKKSLNGRIALVTGAGSGIGRAIATTFAQAGASLALVDQDSQRGMEVQSAIRSQGCQAVFCHADVAKKSDCRIAVQKAVETFGGLSILVNSAGTIRRATILETTEDEWDRGMAVNVKSVYLLCSVAIPIMERAGGGVILNIGSGWGLVGGAKAALYCASKGAVVQLTRAMALDHGKQNIRVNCICPGDTETPMLESEAAQLGLTINLLRKEAGERPLGRLGTPEDVAQAALFLAGDGASYITGTTLVVDGGGLAG